MFPDLTPFWNFLERATVALESIAVSLEQIAGTRIEVDPDDAAQD